MNNNYFNSICPFCRSFGIPYNHPIKNKGIVVCSKLLQHICPRCGKKGHTSKHCTMTYEEGAAKREAERYARWEEVQRIKAAEKVKQEEIKANSWAAKITKKVSTTVISQMEENDKKIRHENDIKMAKATEEKIKSEQEFRKRMEETFVTRMQRKYGIREAFELPGIKHRYYDCYNVDPKIIPTGEFWYFKIEGKKDEKFDFRGVALMERRKPENQDLFKAYLKEKYYVNWIFDSEDTDDNCPYLQNMRKQERIKLEKAEWDWEVLEKQFMQRAKNQDEEDEKEKVEMNRKLQAGEISEETFNNWHWNKICDQIDDYDDYHMMGVNENEYIKREAIAKKEWIARKQAREEQEYEEESLHKRLKSDRRKAREAAAASAKI